MSQKRTLRYVPGRKKADIQRLASAASKARSGLLIRLHAFVRLIIR